MKCAFCCSFCVPGCTSPSGISHFMSLIDARMMACQCTCMLKMGPGKGEGKGVDLNLYC